MSRRIPIKDIVSLIVLLAMAKQAGFPILEGRKKKFSIEQPSPQPKIPRVYDLFEYHLQSESASNSFLIVQDELQA